MKRKYGNNRPCYKGLTFDSNLEMYRYIYLLSQEKKGKISDLRRQVRFQLLPDQRDEASKGRKLIERGVAYKADFVYIRNGVEIVEDAKGLRPKEYIIKRKMMLYFHDIRIHEIYSAGDPLGGA